MGALNYLSFLGTCPACGFRGTLRAEMKLGTLEMREYSVGDQLEWHGESGLRKYDPPATGYIADYGYAECPKCDEGHWVWITVEDNRVVDVKPSPGPEPFSDDTAAP
jgi:hypothetical protein